MMYANVARADPSRDAMRPAAATAALREANPDRLSVTCDAEARLRSQGVDWEDFARPLTPQGYSDRVPSKEETIPWLPWFA